MSNTRVLFPQDFVKNSKPYTGSEISFYHKATVPIIYVLRIFGVYPYKKRADGKILLRNKSSIFAYSVALYVLQSSIAVKTVVNSYGQYRMKKFDLVQMYVVVCLSFIPVLSSPLVWMSAKQLENFFENWTAFQIKYNYVIQDTLSSRNVAWIIFKNAVNFILIYFSFFFIVDIVGTEWFHIAFCITCVVSHSLFMTLCIATEYAFEMIMSHYKKHLQFQINSRRVGIRIVEEYRLLWVSVSQLVQQFGACFSLMLTLHLLLHSVMFVLLVYNFVGFASHFMKTGAYYEFSKIFVAPWIPFAMIYVCCNIGHLITKQCTENIPELIVQMKSKLLIHRSENTVSIKLFLYAVNDFKPTVNILGYFEINRPVFGSIISVLVTYMIVLVQFGSNE